MFIRVEIWHVPDYWQRSKHLNSDGLWTISSYFVRPPWLVGHVFFFNQLDWPFRVLCELILLHVGLMVLFRFFRKGLSILLEGDQHRHWFLVLNWWIVVWSFYQHFMDYEDQSATSLGGRRECRLLWLSWRDLDYHWHIWRQTFAWLYQSPDSPWGVWNTLADSVRLHLFFVIENSLDRHKYWRLINWILQLLQIIPPTYPYWHPYFPRGIRQIILDL